VKSRALLLVLPVVLVLAGCGGKNEKPSAVGGATSQASSVSQNGAAGRYRYTPAQVQAFTRSCRAVPGGSQQSCHCVFERLRQDATPAELVRATSALRAHSMSGFRKLNAAARGCHIEL
jgi:hypothetical protein